MKNIIFIILFFSISTVAFSRIRLNLSVIYKKGIDKGLVLVSEYHSVEEVDEREKVKLIMKNDLKLIISTYFINTPNNYGPSDLLRIEGSIYIKDKKLENTFFNSKINISIGEKKVLVYQNNTGQLIEITIIPEVK